MKQAVIGVDIGGTKIAAHICDHAYNTLHESVVPCPAQVGGDAVMQAVITLCRDLIAIAADTTIVAIGVGTAGQIDPVAGVVLDANENLRDWQGTPIKRQLGEALGLPVWVDNDVRTMALAEITLGAGRAYQHILCITVGTGIGGAIIVDRRLWHGAHFSAGEIGYMLERPHVTIEESASGIALEQHYHHQSSSDQRLSLHQIAAQANNGDPFAQAIIREGATRLAVTIAPVLAFLDPQVLIVGGGVPQIGDLWWLPFTETIQQFRLNSVRSIPVLRAELGNRAGMMGAAALAWQAVEQS